MGEPSKTKPWGWQIDGHHLVINYFVLGDQVVMSPVFVGSEPVHATSGKFKGTIVLQSEQDKGLEVIQALSEQQQAKAILSAAKNGNNALAQAYRDNLDLDYAKFEACMNDNNHEAEIKSDMSEGQKYGVRGTPSVFLGKSDGNKEFKGALISH